jgi:sulfide:quinone oxidoreductase
MDHFSMWLMETRVFPWLYWHRVLNARRHARHFMKQYAPLVRALGLALKQP